MAHCVNFWWFGANTDLETLQKIFQQARTDLRDNEDFHYYCIFATLGLWSNSNILNHGREH